jgi:hypothetical protein
MDINSLFSPKTPEAPKKIEIVPENIFKDVYEYIFTKEKHFLSHTFSFNFNEETRLNINIYLLYFIIIANVVLVTRRWTSEKGNKTFIKYYNELYHDFLKYLLIEIAIIGCDAIEENRINISYSVARVSIILSALLVFHNIKDSIGIH